MIIFPDFRRILSKKCKVYIKLTIIQGKNTKLGKIINAVCRKVVEKKAVLEIRAVIGVGAEENKAHCCDPYVIIRVLLYFCVADPI